MWTTPHSLAVQDRLTKNNIEIELQARIYESFLRATTEATRESYGAGLVRFTDFCDSRAIPEESRMPAHRDILAGFVASWIGNIGGKAIRNWLLGLRQWHLLNDAAWHSDEGWLTTLKKAGDRAGDSFKRPPRGPITKQHMRALRRSLDLSTGRGASTWSTATSCFSGCRRLGELLVVSVARFSLQHDTCRETRISHSVVNGHRVIAFHIVWTKTTTIAGAECVLTETLGEDADLCPVRALLNHLEINHSPPVHTPLFAFREDGRWHTPTKAHFIAHTSSVYIAAGLETVYGHSYRIGGSVELLLAGVEPEVIMKLGGWTSLCFLIYWRRLEQIIPDRITTAWKSRIHAFASAHGHSPDAHLSFDVIDD
jgi:hypothetical protein